MSKPALKSGRLLDQLRERIRYAHYSLKTEKVYVYWVRFFIRLHKLRHPREMGAAEVETFLTYLANERHVSPSTHRQALSAILYLYKEVLDIDLPWMQQIGRPQVRFRIPVALSRDEVARLLVRMDARHRVICQLLYGAGFRLMECMRLRVKDIDFDRKVIVVREGKGSKDRVVMLPASLTDALRNQLAAARVPWATDRAAQAPGVWLPDALCKKYPRQPTAGHGSGHFAHYMLPAIRVPAFAAGIISSKAPWGGPSAWPRRHPASPRRSPLTSCGIHSQRTCWSRELIFAELPLLRIHALTAFAHPCAAQELLGHSDVSTTMIYTHVMNSSAAGTPSPLDALIASRSAA